MRGKFITFEGPEGSGKSTQIRLLAARLREAGRGILVTREPGGTPLAENIRAMVREESGDPPVPHCETLLFLASRAQLVENAILPALERGEWVLCDRFADSTFAYQGYGRGIDMATLRILNGFATGGLTPDLTILLDVPPEVSRKRLAARQAAAASAADRIEQAGAAFHRRLRDGFLEMARNEQERFAVIDATAPVEIVAESVFAAVSRLSDVDQEI